MRGLTCACGAHDATRAALQQMSPESRARFEASAKACKTCAQDRKRDPVSSTGQKKAQAND